MPVLKFCLILLLAPHVDRQDHLRLLNEDFTGLQWCQSFEQARQQAANENKVLMLKPASFRTSEDRLSPTFEVFRAGPLVDPRVQNLLNRRFVLFYFDLDEFGGAYSADATKLAKSTCSELRHAGTPPVLFYDEELELIHQISNFASVEQFLEALETILDTHEQYAQLTEEEQAITDPLEKARVHYDLRQFEHAAGILNSLRSSEAYYLRGLVGRETQDWAGMLNGFKMVTDNQRQYDIRVDAAYHLWHAKEYDELQSALAAVGPSHPRYQEAKYLEGLAHWHLMAAENKNKPVEKHSEPTKAFDTWRKAIEHDPTTAWAVRLDWTLGMAQLGEMVSPIERPDSLLDREYLSPNSNPDLNIFR